MVTYIEIITALVVVLAITAEILHARRCRRVRHLAHGPAGKPHEWTLVIPFLRVISLGCICWSFLILDTVGPETHADEEKLDDKELHRLLIVYDVSPSMTIADAGPRDAKISRRKRAAEVFETILDGISPNPVLVNFIAVHSNALPVMTDTRDMNVVRNVLNDLPMEFAFKPGHTHLISGLKMAAEKAKMWPKDSTTLIVFSDGDTEEDIEFPKMPASISNSLFFGLGHTSQGTFINGHTSTQTARTFARMARRYRGEYVNVNGVLPREEILKGLGAIDAFEGTGRFDPRDIAMFLLFCSTFLLAILPVLLAIAGSPWKVKKKYDVDERIRA